MLIFLASQKKIRLVIYRSILFAQCFCFLSSRKLIVVLEGRKGLTQFKMGDIAFYQRQCIGIRKF